MTNVFGIQYNKNKETSVTDFDGSCFLLKQIESDELQSLDSIDDAQEAHEKKLKLPLPLSILKSLSFFVGIVTVISLLRAEVSMAEAYANAPFIFYMLPVAWIIFGILQISEIIKRKKHLASEEFKEFVKESEEAALQAMEKLGIPSSAPLVDVFSYAYKRKKDKDVPVSSDCKYVTIEFFVFQNESTLYLADHTAVFAFEKKDFIKIEKINNRTTSRGWNKDEACDSPKYKKYKISQNQYGTVFYKYHYSLQLSHSGKVFEILIPPYEIAMIAKILDLSYEE